ncbi:hypothetical protein B0H13DRAFT_1904454 [Mycena leptocephala]|nr:hypothetical protein B0H13DRAFT_1904454 [Mycena leptocephala]
MNSARKYCGTECRTLQGLHSHLAQTKLCRQKKFEEYAADSSADSGSDSDSSDSDSNLAHHGDIDLNAEDINMDLAGPESFEPDAAQSEEETYFAVDPSRPDLANAPIEAAEDAAANPQKRPRETVEEVEDEDARWFQPFREEHYAGAVHEKCQTQFEKLREEQKTKGQALWEPFESQDEWLMTSGLSNKKIDKYLKLKKVRKGINPSFHNSRAFLKRIDALPNGPKWMCYPFELVGHEVDVDGNAKREVVEMWCRDPVECAGAGGKSCLQEAML